MIGLGWAVMAMLLAVSPDDQPMERIGLSSDGKGFAGVTSGRPFRPLGFNYDHDERGRLIEDYWADEWAKVEADFAEMSKLGANVVRVHLQFGRFMKGPSEPDERSLSRLKDLLVLSEKQGLYLDLTGLGCYHAADVPKWYDELDEEGRWKAQAAFWEAVGRACAESPAVFCYDLMNEPVVPGGKRKPGEWLGPPFAGKHFVQFVTLDQGGRPRPEVAKAWIVAISRGLRKVDPGRLVTVGLVDWSLDRPGLTSGFVPSSVAGDLDFLCVHLYPEKDGADRALEVLRAFREPGKPVLVEETFPLKCSAEEFERFATGAIESGAGLVGFYWGKTPDELRESGSIGDAMTRGWLEVFGRLAVRGKP